MQEQVKVNRMKNDNGKFWIYMRVRILFSISLGVLLTLIAWTAYLITGDGVQPGWGVLVVVTCVGFGGMTGVLGAVMSAIISDYVK